jgi:hypothetical protein
MPCTSTSSWLTFKTIQPRLNCIVHRAWKTATILEDHGASHAANNNFSFIGERSDRYNEVKKTISQLTIVAWSGDDGRSRRWVIIEGELFAGRKPYAFPIVAFAQAKRNGGQETNRFYIAKQVYRAHTGYDWSLQECF